MTFKTVTYHGDSGRLRARTARTASVFSCRTAAQAAGLGALGGSLAYSCSNSNTPHDGLIGGYIGLGIDEYGNFLNGTNLVAGYTGTNVASGDNSAYGYGYKPGRIGLRGAGNIAWRRSRRRTATTRTTRPALLSGLARDLLQHCGRHLQRRQRQLHRHLLHRRIVLRLDHGLVQQSMPRQQDLRLHDQYLQ